MREKSLGFFGKMLIYPRQLEWLDEIYMITPEQRAWSVEVVEAFESAGSGAIDLPVYRMAKRLLQRFHRYRIDRCAVMGIELT